jgi:hypothetical protein
MPRDIYAAIAAWVRAEATRQPVPPPSTAQPVSLPAPATPADDASGVVEPSPVPGRMTRRCWPVRLVGGAASAARRGAAAVTARWRRKC